MFNVNIFPKIMLLFVMANDRHVTVSNWMLFKSYSKQATNEYFKVRVILRHEII